MDEVSRPSTVASDLPRGYTSEVSSFASSSSLHNPTQRNNNSVHSLTPTTLTVPAPPIFPGSHSNYLHMKPRSFVLRQPLQDTETVQVMQRVLEFHQTHQLLLESNLELMANHAGLLTTDTSTKTKDDINASSSPQNTFQDIQQLKVKLTLYARRKKILQSFLVNFQETYNQLSTSSLRDPKHRHYLHKLVQLLKDIRSKGVLLEESTTPSSSSSSFLLDGVSALSKQIDQYMKNMEEQIRLQKEELDNQISTLQNNLQHELDHHIHQIDNQAEEENQRIIQQYKQVEETLQQLEQEWKNQDVQLKVDEQGERNQLHQQQEEEEEEPVTNKSIQPPPPPLSISDQEKNISLIQSDKVELEEGEEIETTTSTSNTTVVNDTTVVPILSDSELKKIQIQEKQKELEKLNESKSEMIWLLKEVIIAEKKRKLLLEKEKK